MNEISLIIGADLVPTENNFTLFREGDIHELFGEELLSVLSAADFRIFNLETPLCNQATPLEKNGPNLIAPTETINGIKGINPSLVTIANNHVMDQGSAGLDSTIRALVENDIPYVGAGNDLAAASEPYIIMTEDGMKIGVYGCAEHEFTIATGNSPGANPFDPLETPDHIAKLKSASDYVIVLYHGGKEQYKYPSPALRQVCRKLIEKGADIVVCQHSHCIGCFEEYLDGTIVYGQGNFIFDNGEHEYSQTSLLIKVFLKDKHVEYVPIIKKRNNVRLASKDQAEVIMTAFDMRSAQIINPDFVKNEYRQLVGMLSSQYLKAFRGADGFVFKVLDRLFKRKLIYKLYSKKNLLRIRNYVECEAHREIILAYLNDEKNV